MHSRQNRFTYRMRQILLTIHWGSIGRSGSSLDSLESHPLQVQGSSMVVSLLLPVFPIKDDAISEHGDKLGMGNSDVAS
jgi:hypothetical protein